MGDAVKEVGIPLDLRLTKVNGMKGAGSGGRTYVDHSCGSADFAQDDRDVAESYQFCAHCYISKPIGIDEFAKALAQLGFYWLLVTRTPLKAK